MKLSAVLAAALFAGSAIAAPCTPQGYFDLEPDWYGGMTVPANIEGRQLTLLVDTGGVTSMLTESTVAALGLPRRPITGARITLYGGKTLHEFVRVPAIAVGTSPMRNAAFFVMPDNRVPYALSGTLAPDVLSNYDVEFDFAKARMTLYPAGKCPLEHALALKPDDVHHLIADVELDGRHLDAFLDTGASRSDFSLESAQQMFGPALDAKKPARRADAEDGVYTYGFKKLTIGGIAVSDPDLLLVPDDIARRPADSPRLVLGMNVLRHLHLFIAYSRNKIMITPAQTHRADLTADLINPTTHK